MTSLWRLLRPFVRPYYIHIFGSFLAICVASSAVLWLGQGLRYLIDEGFGMGSQTQLDLSVFFLFVVVAILGLASYARFYLVSWVGEKVLADLRSAMMARLLKMPIRFFETTSAIQVVTRLITDASLIQVLLAVAIPVAVRNAFMFVGGVVMLVKSSLYLSALTFFIIPITILPLIYYGKRVRVLSRDSQDAVGVLSIRIDEIIRFVRTVYSFNRSAHDLADLNRDIEAAFDKAAIRIHARAVLTVAVIMIVFASMCIVLWQGGEEVLVGKMTKGTLSAFIFYAAVVGGAVASISEVSGDVMRATGAGDRLRQLEKEMRLPMPKLNEKGRYAELVDKPTYGLKWEDVTMAYPSSPDHPVIQDFTLDIAPGEKVAFVGASGAGKSTLLNLLLRFYDPSKGTISLDNQNIQDFDPREVRQILGHVPQEPTLFRSDVITNIRYSRPDATDEDVREAAIAAQADGFISELPQGYQTFVGESGVLLSGGQKQRIALARLILYRPKIVLLDEATSALDAENEYALQQALDHLMHDKTTLIIAHKISTVRSVDRIVLLNKGHIEAVGNHDTLLATNALYRRYNELQLIKDPHHD